jgi:aspartate kinase
MKFGGTSVGDGEKILRVAGLVGRHGDDPALAVVSAMGGVTDALLALSKAALIGEKPAADLALREIGARHQAAVDAMALTPAAAAACRGEIGREVERLDKLATGVSLLGELSLRTSDAIAAAGEMLSATLLTEALRKLGTRAVKIDPRELMATDAAYGAAVPDEPGISARLFAKVLPERAAGRTVVTGGFVGAAPDGSLTTLGRGGSDFSAALFGAGLRDAGVAVEAIEIWTDVDGILTADPRIVPDARLIPEVSADEAAELAFFGAKVLHPATIRPAVTRGIPVVVRNTFRPGVAGTVVRADVAGSGVRALAARKGVAALFIGSPRMLLAHGYAAKVFGVFEAHGVPVDVIATSEVSISTTVDEKAPIEAIVRDLSRFAEVQVLRHLAVVSVVGKGLRSMPGVAGRIFSALGDVNAVMISQGASDTNVTFVVAAGQAADALRRLHAEFFREEGR